MPNFNSIDEFSLGKFEAENEILKKEKNILSKSFSSLMKENEQLKLEIMSLRTNNCILQESIPTIYEQSSGFD
jgi:regulator of replication initiation timing